MKLRETRRKVLIKARMRGPNGWHDASILDLSSRGMLLHAPTAAARGAYVEIRRGHHVIVARVAWAHQQRFGVRSQDPVPVEELLGNVDATASPPSAQSERRAVPRPTERPEDASRHRGRAFEFAGVVLAGLCAASVAYAAIGEALARPMAAISAAIDPQ